MFIQEFYSNIHAIDTFVPQFTTIFKGTRIIVSVEFIFEVLRVPTVVRLDYPSHTHLCTISLDELISLFYEKAMVWGDTLNFSITEFAKGRRILNMVMTFVLTPWSRYYTITKPYARLLISLLEDLSIDFPSHMKLFMIDIYGDTATCDKIIFLQISHAFSHTCTSPFLPLLSFTPWVPLARNL